MRLKTRFTKTIVNVPDDNVAEYIEHGFKPLDESQVEPKKAAKKPAKKTTKKKDE